MYLAFFWNSASSLTAVIMKDGMLLLPLKAVTFFKLTFVRSPACRIYYGDCNPAGSKWFVCRYMYDDDKST